MIIACAGGGSNFAGLTFPFLGRKLRGEANYRVIAAEPEAAPSLTRGVYAYDFGDTGHMAPIVKMHTLGSEFIPEPIHAGGLRYHGMAPLVSLLKEHGVIEAQSVHQRAAFEAGVQFARTEGILPAPETHPRDQGRRRRGARRRRRPASRGSSCSTCRATATSTWPRTSAYLAGPARGLRVPGGEGRGRARGPARRRLIAGRGDAAPRPRRLPLGSSRAQARLPRLWPPDLHGLAAGVAVRRGTAMPALRRLPGRRAALHRPAHPASAARTRPTIPGPPPTRASGGAGERRVTRRPPGIAARPGWPQPGCASPCSGSG